MRGPKPFKIIQQARSSPGKGYHRSAGEVKLCISVSCVKESGVRMAIALFPNSKLQYKPHISSPKIPVHRKKANHFNPPDGISNFILPQRQRQLRWQSFCKSVDSQEKETISRSSSTGMWISFLLLTNGKNWNLTIFQVSMRILFSAWVFICSESSDEENYDLGVKAALCLLNFYKSEISPILPRSCRFVPTCSEYSMIAYKKYGFVKGTILTSWRICRCNPLGGRGFDPPRWFDEEEIPPES
ncbi:OLC1v1034860C2 [Oldenlandia corymbosa var. corymbosa]|uniref:OLC1v1034860C2 n=1 Tax=Oldenlandia corymbosa var. corymbosa TaxID=529605 RepID=A0AAV1CRR8_OLDCO|nr:OLC1v1034860C2 [Oldenlandia corymbosa var. corymbosa]